MDMYMTTACSTPIAREEEAPALFSSRWSTLACATPTCRTRPESTSTHNGAVWTSPLHGTHSLLPPTDSKIGTASSAPLCCSDRPTQPVGTASRPPCNPMATSLHARNAISALKTMRTLQTAWSPFAAYTSPMQKVGSCPSRPVSDCVQRSAAPTTLAHSTGAGRLVQEQRQQ